MVAKAVLSSNLEGLAGAGYLGLFIGAFCLDVRTSTFAN